MRIKNSEGATAYTVDARKPFFIEIEYEILQEIPFIWLGFSLSTLNGFDVMTSVDGDVDEHITGLRKPGKYRSVCELPANLLNGGRFSLSAYAARTLVDEKPEIFVSLEYI